MRLGGSRRSDNIEDRRGLRVVRAGAGLGVGTLVLLAIGYFMGVNPATLLNLAEVTQTTVPRQIESAPTHVILQHIIQSDFRQLRGAG